MTPAGPRALVLSAETAAACAVVRSLHAAGFDVTALAEAWHSPAVWSAKCARHLTVGSWTPADLDRIVGEQRADVVVPVTEGDLARLATVRDRVEARSKVVAPGPEALDEATDKAFTSEVAAALGIAVPEQWVLPASAAALETAPAPFPLVVKPSRSRVLRLDGSVWGGTASYVADLAGLNAARAVHSAAGVATIVQRPVRGAGVLASVLLRKDGTPSLAFVHRRVREARPEGGPSACAVSAPPEPRFVEPAVHLAHALGVFGVPIQFEFRVEGLGAPVLLDVNPRPWGTLGLALDCGVNFYGLAARHALGDELPAPPPAYRAGVVRHHLAFELRRAWAVCAGDPQPGFPGVWPDRAAAAFEWIFPPSQGLVGKLDDPMPALADVCRLVARAVSAKKEPGAA